MEWNFSATSHGKGVVDGLSGTVKRSVWRQIKSEKVSVANAEEYAVVASERNPNVSVFFIPKEQIYNRAHELEK